MLINFLHQVPLKVLFIKKVLSCLMDSDGLCHTEIKDDLYMDSYCRMVFTITSHYAHRSDGLSAFWGWRRWKPQLTRRKTRKTAQMNPERVNGYAPGCMELVLAAKGQRAGDFSRFSSLVRRTFRVSKGNPLVPRLYHPVYTSPSCLYFRKWF